MYKFVISFFVAFVAGATVAPALATETYKALGTETHNMRNSNACEISRGEQHAVPSRENRRFGFAADVRKNENVRGTLNAGSNDQYAVDRPRPAGGTRDTNQPGKLTLLENATLPLNERSKAAVLREDQTWVRLSDAPNIPEPGSWAVLLAGFLGICAVARPRIFSS